MIDTDFSILKTSYGMKHRWEYFAKYFSPNLVGFKKDDKLEANITAISLFYNVSHRVALQYYHLISHINKMELLKIRRRLGME